MNKTLVYLGIVGIVLIGLIGVVVLQVFEQDATPFITLFSTTLPIAITAAYTIDQLSKVKVKTEKIEEKTQQIARSVNGSTTTLLAMAEKGVTSPDDVHQLAIIENQNRDLVADLPEKGGDHVA